MRFIPNGPDVPEKLISAQEKGDVVFVCGAGVSMRLGLPSFRELVERIYAALHEDWHGHPSESEGMEPGGAFYGQFDRVLRQLEKRLQASDTPQNRGMRERLKQAIRTALAVPPNPDLSAHLDLVELSRDEEGTKRLVTTNFDTLFERSWAAARATRLPSHAGVAMPQPRVAGFAGIMHLHGRVADAGLALAETDFVVTSAEFGDAYLRSGWASRYVYDLARTQTIVLVGYSADDPPVRYLLEALEADRTRYPDLHDVYAFGACDPGAETLADARWKAKGVTESILYHAPNHDHSELYLTLASWRDYASDPTSWRRAKLRAIFDQGFAQATPQSVGEVVALLQHGDASTLLGELSPDPRWLEELVAKNVFRKDGTNPGPWFASRIGDGAMIRAATRISKFDDATRWFVRKALRETNNVLPLYARAWDLLAAPQRRSRGEDRDDDWFRVEPRLKGGDAGYEARDVVARIVTPRFHIDPAFRHDDEDQEPEERLVDLLRIDFKSAEYPNPNEIVGAWSDKADDAVALLNVLMRRLLDALEQAEDVGFLDGYDRSNADVPSVAEHGQNRYATGFYPAIRVIADVWTRLAAADAGAARGIAMQWQRSKFRLIRRLGLFALADKAYAAVAVGGLVGAMSHERFWDRSEQVELMRLLTARWSELSSQDQTTVEERIRVGPVRETYGPDAFASDEDWQSVADSAVHGRLSRLQSANVKLSEASQKTMDEIQTRHPKWAAVASDREDFAVWSETGSGPTGHPELLTGVPDDKLVSEATRLQRERYFEEGDVWRLVANADPERALRGLHNDADKSIWDAGAWRTVFVVAENRDDPAFQASFAEEVSRIPAATMGELVSSAASWLRVKRETLPKDGPGGFLALWDLLATAAYPAAESETPPPNDGEKLVNEALNRPGGVLAWALLDSLNASKPSPASGLPVELEPRFNRLLAAAGRPGLLARVMIAEMTSWLYQVAPDWTAAHVLTRLQWTHAEAPFMWHAHARGHGPSGSALFNILRDPQLAAFERNELRDDDLALLSDRFFWVGVWHHYGNNADLLLEDAAIKRVLTIGPSACRKNASFNFWKIMGNVKFDEIGQLRRWREAIGPYFAAIWPLDAALRSKSCSRDLAHMALDSGEAFPEVVDAIRDLVVPYELYNLAHSLRFDAKHSALVATHPLAFLRLASALIDPKAFPIPPDLQALLDDARAADASVVEAPEYIRLAGLAKLGNS